MPQGQWCQRCHNGFGTCARASMAKLREFGTVGWNARPAVPPVSASVRLEQLDEHPWGTESHTLPKLFLPGAVRHFFSDDRVPNGHDLVDEAPMQTLPMGSQFPLAGGLAFPGDEIPFAVLPPETLLATLPDPSALIVVVRVVGAALALHLAL